jgi:DNA-directed RNA polymerase subunit RPC12/RpoP
MRKPRPATFNPAQALHLIAKDRTGSALSCPSCSGNIMRHPDCCPPPPRAQVTLKCSKCGRVARYVAGPAEQMAS